MSNPLPYRVECDVQGKTYFEVIAGFNVESAARNYAIECAKAHPANLYRVKHGSKVLHNETYIKGETILATYLGDGPARPEGNAHKGGI